MKKLLLTLLVLGTSASCQANQYRARSATDELRPLFWAVPGLLGSRALSDCYSRYAAVSFLRGSLQVGREFAWHGIAVPYNRHNNLHLDDAAELVLNTIFAVILAPAVLTGGAFIKTGQGVASAVHAFTQTPVHQVAVLACSAALAGYCMYELYKDAKAQDKE